MVVRDALLEHDMGARHSGCNKIVSAQADENTCVYAPADGSIETVAEAHVQVACIEAFEVAVEGWEALLITISTHPSAGSMHHKPRTRMLSVSTNFECSQRRERMKSRRRPMAVRSAKLIMVITPTMNGISSNSSC